MPWQKNYDENEVLERAMRAFWAQGYEATSIGDLVRATGINRGSLYAAFNSKHDLFLRALRHYDKRYRVDHLQFVADRHDPLDAIITVFETAARKPGDENIPRGCLLVNTALELSPHDPEVRGFVEQSLHAVEEFFFECVRKARRDGSIRHELDARATAQTLLSLFLGLRVLTRARARQATIDAITSQARAMLI